MTAASGTTVLAYIPSPPQGVWYLGDFPLRAYALCIIVGIVAAVWWGNRRWVARGGGEGEVLDVAIWAVPFGLVGGRLYHLATDWRTYFGDGPKTPIDALKIWDGGLGIWGAVLLGAVGAWIGTRRAGISLPAFGDAIAPPILLAQAIGRLGNYFNQELYGAHTSLPWGLEIYERVDANGNVGPGLIDGRSTGTVVDVVQPTFLYELLWNVLVVVVLVVLDRRLRIGHGRLFAGYVAGYCLGRFGIELLREDTATHVFGIRINVFTAAIVFLCAVAYIVLATKGRETPDEVYRAVARSEVDDDVYRTGARSEADDDASETHDDDESDHCDATDRASEPDSSEMGSERGTAESNADESDAGGSDSVESDVAEPDTTEPDATEPSTTDPDAAETTPETDGSGSETADPATTEGDADTTARPAR